MIKSSEKELTKEFLESRLDYGSETGRFYWKISKGGKKAGDIAGSVNDQGYVLIRVLGEIYRAHRLAWIIMTGEIPDGEIDHIDGDRSNNRWDNLRLVDRKQNKQNLGKPVNNKSGHIGVMWYKAGQKWHAQITINGKTKHLGYFERIEDAIAARKEAEDFYGFHENHGNKDSWNARNGVKNPENLA